MEDNLYKSGLRPAFDAYMIERASEERDYGSYWSGSGAGYCMRKMIFDRLKVTPALPKDARLQKVFESGHIFHAWAQGVTVKAGISIAQEYRLQDNTLMIQGHFDDLIKTETGLILYDYKTANSRSFTYKKGKPMGHYHRSQVGTYLTIIRKVVEGDENVKVWEKDGDGLYNKDVTESFGRLIKSLGDLKEGRILSISKDDLRMEETQLLWNNGLLDTITTYWNTLNEYWKARRLPPCTCGEYDKNDKTGIGFMASDRYNPYFYDGEPCSLKLYQLWKEGRSSEYVKEV